MPPVVFEVVAGADASSVANLVSDDCKCPRVTKPAIYYRHCKTINRGLGMDDIQRDVEGVSQIEAVTNILNIVCDITGMRFSALARATGTRWIACNVMMASSTTWRAGGS